MTLKDFKSSKLFKSKNKYLRAIHFSPRNFQKNEVLRLQQVLRLEPKIFKCLTPGSKYHVSITPLNTFQASQTHPNKGCLSHCFRHDP